jgi:hypothetical protein
MLMPLHLDGNVTTLATAWMTSKLVETLDKLIMVLKEFLSSNAPTSMWLQAIVTAFAGVGATFHSMMMSSNDMNPIITFMMGAC